MTIAAIILIITLVIGISTDIVLALLKGQKTYSQQFSIWAFGKFPSVNFMLCFLMGHFFWPYSKIGVPFWVALLVGGAFMISIEIVQIFTSKYPKWCFILFSVLGYLTGGLFF
jgi:hypothetical protein